MGNTNQAKVPKIVIEPGKEVIPVEEKALEDLFPDLNVVNLMPVEKIDSSNHSHLHAEYLKNPLPVLKIELSKEPLIPSFALLENIKKGEKIKEIKPFTRYVGEYCANLEPSEDELAERVEYDMDEIDRIWLASFNLKQKKLGEKECSFDLFEFIIDQLEKAWFDLVKDIPKTVQEDRYPEETTCAVCDDGEAENSNAIVFCDGCNLAVHQDCYGVPFIPEGQWLCRKCMLSPENPVECLLCPTEGGAYKQTTNNRWAHLLCAMWIPECHISNTVFMEPIEGISNIQKSRWKLACYICEKKYGAPIQCSTKNCFTAYHPTCARRSKLYMRMRGQAESHNFKSYCDRHTPKEYKDRVDVDRYLQLAHQELSAPLLVLPPTPTPLTSSAATTPSQSPSKHKKKKFKKESPSTKAAAANGPVSVFSTTSPVIPAVILKRIASLNSPLLPKKRAELITAICKYWSLKKEARRGAALLKRLHLEPWTANASASKEDDELKAQRYQTLAALRKDFEKVRILLDMVRRRERQKLKNAKLSSQIFELASNPLHSILQKVLDKCRKVDKYRIFAVPVSLESVPDYDQYVKNPMDFATMQSKLDNFEYLSLDDFSNDIYLICDNCLIYNKPMTIFAKAAAKLSEFYCGILKELEEHIVASGIDPSTSVWVEGVTETILSSFTPAN